eukprot:CAMPEP_0194767346 /NCGR_PEP_ID=MMETSP0323_2-20130528/35507_1 /TAXON_ID=2866 ORGANISM="Crypthecodinium cohnii, Strain Seligo" /NCGR_SAMPLE_ID=MMETSP0323_2 /ASSEMBLY_ACC=CAM_ASM_000346 /LENGTH=93 /DNA_ID=CAMNT_0039699011 /DNA_START=64 /DNA_END=342 /DNA_ORIENTATION=-
MEEELWRRDPDGARISMLGDDGHRSRGSGHRGNKDHRDKPEESEVLKKMRQEEEEERRRLQRSILEKYTTNPQAAAARAAQKSDMEQPDVLRL